MTKKEKQLHEKVKTWLIENDLYDKVDHTIIDDYVYYSTQIAKVRKKIKDEFLVDDSIIINPLIQLEKNLQLQKIKCVDKLKYYPNSLNTSKAENKTEKTNEKLNDFILKVAQ